jgi:hypothetical protein
MTTQRKRYCTWSRGPVDGALVGTFADGKVVRYPLADIHPDCVPLVMEFGAKQKMASDAAEANNVQEFRDIVTETWTNLTAGTFYRTTSGFPSRTLVIEALMRLVPKDKAAKVTAQSDEKLKMLAKRRDVREMMLKIQAERIKAAPQEADAPIELDN